MQLAGITDEFSFDLGTALEAMASTGMTGVELRVVGTKNVLDLTNDELIGARAAIEARGMRVLSIASPLLKCVLPDAPSIDTRLQQDVFGSAYTFEDQPRLTARAFEVATICGAPIVRVFSYWRTVDPSQCFDRITAALRALGDQAADRDLIIGVENEHACNVGTGAELGAMLTAVDHPHVKGVWDPANALVLGETPFPDGYAHLSLAQIAHVHAKDCVVHGHTPTWGLLGEMGIDWRGQFAALVRDGYHGAISLETHWRGPNNDRLEASLISARKLRTMVAEA